MIKFALQQCINGEYKGRFFVFNSHVKGAVKCYQEVVNGKINRYPFFTINDKDMCWNGIKLPYDYNRQIELSYKVLESKHATQEQIDKALVIAYRIIDWDKTGEQFGIESSVNYDYKEKCSLYTIRVTDTSNKLFSKTIADITLYKDEFYVLHKKIHYDTFNKYSGGYRSPAISEENRKTFDHPYYGIRYKKEINLLELNRDVRMKK